MRVRAPCTCTTAPTAPRCHHHRTTTPTHLFATQVNVQQTVYRNYQRLTVQESPGSVPAGRLPRQKDVILVDDLIDIARPGDAVDIVGVYTSSFDYGLNVKSGFPVFSTVIEANHIEKRSDAYAVSALTDEDTEACRKLGQDPRIGMCCTYSYTPTGLATSMHVHACMAHGPSTDELTGTHTTSRVPPPQPRA